MKSKKVLMVAGEASGDLQGARLAEAIQQTDPNIKFFGVGGEHLKRRGMELLYHSHSLAVVGFTEVFIKIGPILRALKGLKQFMDQEKPDLLILIDFQIRSPEFLPVSQYGS